MEPEIMNEENVYSGPGFDNIIATPGQRFANYIIDLVIFYIVMLGVGILIGIVLAATDNSYLLTDKTVSATLLSYGISYFVYFLFYLFCEGASNGRSVGKLITKTKVLRQDDSPITWNDALIRSLCRLVPFEPFSAFGGYPWHDAWSKTKVIKIA